MNFIFNKTIRLINDIYLMMEIKGPFSYSGNKYRIWKKHFKESFSNYSKIHEPFLGSGVCLYNSNNGGIGIDMDENVIQLHKSLFNDDLVYNIERTYNEYFPNGRDKECYLKLRSDFNESWKQNGTCSDNTHMLHLLIQLSFNSLLRFSKNGFNVPFGMKQVDFDRILNHQRIVKEKEFEFINGSYDSLDLSKVDKETDLIYFDPPYIASKFQYGGWEKEDELELLDYIDNLNKDGYSFLLSNTFSHRGVVNEDLINWSDKYNVKSINMSYNSWSAAVKSVSNEKNTLEVIVSNF